MRSRRCLRRPRLQNRLKNTPRLQLPKPPTSRSLLSDPRNPPNDQPPTTNHRLSPSCQARYPPIKSKLQLPAARRRDGRVAEGARLESVFRGNSNVGSNPTLSARILHPSVSATGNNHAETQTRKIWLGSLRPRPRLYGPEFWLGSSAGQTSRYRAHPGRRGTRRYVLRYRRSLRPIHQ